MKHNTPIVLTRFHDPGHSWLKVPFYLLVDTGCEKAISPYSYFKNGFGYLEEDCDLSTFWMAAKLSGIKINIEDEISNHDNPIRNYFGYPSYSKWKELADEIYAKHNQQHPIEA
jgi:hypothetical protein